MLRVMSLTGGDIAVKLEYSTVFVHECRFQRISPDLGVSSLFIPQRAAVLRSNQPSRVGLRTACHPAFHIIVSPSLSFVYFYLN